MKLVQLHEPVPACSWMSVVTIRIARAALAAMLCFALCALLAPACPGALTSPSMAAWRGKQYDTTNNGALMGGYFLLDAMASRSIGGGVQLLAAAENLLDRGYLFSLNGGPELDLPITARFDFPQR